MTTPRVRGKNPAVYRRVMEDQRTGDPLSGRTQADIDLAAADRKLKKLQAELGQIAEGEADRG